MVALLICSSFAVSACHSSSEPVGEDRGSEGTVSIFSQLFNSDSALTSLIESEVGTAIEKSFPNPEIPQADQPFQTQPDQRFEHWSLSAMVQDQETGDWEWIEQQFFRIAVQPANGTSNPSAWGFRDVMAQQYSRYNFNTTERQFSSTAERRTLQLSDVTEHSVFVNDTVAKLHTNDCESTITLDRFGATKTWNTRECPNRIRFGNTIISTATGSFVNGVGWMSHVYGQLPNAGGVVVIDRLEVVLSDNERLHVNRSRRRSGTGPITVEASLVRNDTRQALRNVKWVERFDGESLYPSAINMDIPSLSLTLLVELPKTQNNGLAEAGFGSQHGVLVTIDDTVLPGVVTMQPRT